MTRSMRSLISLLILIFFLSLLYLTLGSIETFDSLVWRLASSLSKEALSRLLLRSGSSVTLIMAVGFALRAFFLATEGGLSMANYMMPHGAAESSNSDLFTYTSDLVEDSASSGLSSSVNQPLPGQQAMPPALPVMQEAANPVLPDVPYPHDEIIGGDSIDRIKWRLLSQSTNPSAQEIILAGIQAEDLFEVKVDIIRRMATLDPEGDWLGRGARALDNPRTATGEDSLDKLYRLRADLAHRGVRSRSFCRW